MKIPDQLKLHSDKHSYKTRIQNKNKAIIVTHCLSKTQKSHIVISINNYNTAQLWIKSYPFA